MHRVAWRSTCMIGPMQRQCPISRQMTGTVTKATDITDISRVANARASGARLSIVRTRFYGTLLQRSNGSTDGRKSVKMAEQRSSGTVGSCLKP